MGAEQRDRQDTLYVAAAPPKTLSDELLKKAASLIGKDIADTRLLLAGELPRVLASMPDSATAESTARGLQDAGFVAFVCGDSELRNRAESFLARTVIPAERAVTFRDRHGGEVVIEAGDAFLIIRGKLRAAAPENTSTTKMKLNVTATVLTGGLPIMRRVTKETTRESSQAEDFMAIYDRRSSDPRVEMSRSQMDYAFLGPELTPFALANFEIVAKKLREWFPPAIFDDRLSRHFKTDLPSEGPGEALEINRKLIYLNYLAMERRAR